MPRSFGSRTAPALPLLILWAVAVSAGSASLVAYSGTPGEQERAPGTWPLDAAFAPMPTGPSLIMFVHPRCPCSRASMREFARLMADLDMQVSARILFLSPGEQGEAWSRSDLRAAAERIPGVTVALDRDGAEARRFGATTSGHVVLYDASGRLLFSGGITIARGHEGASLGRHVIADLVEGRPTETTTTPPTFGCPLYESDRCCATGEER